MRYSLRLTVLSAFAGLAIAALSSGPAFAQQSEACPSAPADLARNIMPEIAHVGSGNVTNGTILLQDDYRDVIGTKVQSGSGTAINCNIVPQRFYGAVSPTVPGAPAPPRVAMAGPTIRAEVGDVVELVLGNAINPLHFNATWDTGKCDTSTAGYPGTPPTGDKYPNCFHGSTTANIHFHGTHTSPTSTADNVFLGVTVLPAALGSWQAQYANLQPSFKDFFSSCQANIGNTPLNQWPTKWSDLGNSQFIATQRQWMPAYQPELWKLDQEQERAGAWPQYYVGFFPYCFVLPNYYNAAGQPSGVAMGQAPGTHWYHAHKHGATTLNLNSNMDGALIVEDNVGPVGSHPAGYDYALNAYYNGFRQAAGLSTQVSWTRQQPILIVNQIGATPGLERGGPPGGQDPLSVNGFAPGATPPMTMKPGEVKMWRIVNASSGNGFYFSRASLPSGFVWQQLAQDGVQFSPDNYSGRAMRPVYVAPGNRIDLLVQAPATAGSYPVRVTPGQSAARAIASQLAGRAPTTLFNVNVSAGTSIAMPIMPASAMPNRPGFLNDINTASIPKANAVTLVFNSSSNTGAPAAPSHHKIGKSLGGPLFQFDDKGAEVNMSPNQPYLWTIFNTTATNPARLDHPFHIHINPFQITTIFDPNQYLTDTAGVVVTSAKYPAGVPRYWVANSNTPQDPVYGKYQCRLDVSGYNTTAPGGASGSTKNWNTTWVPCRAPQPVVTQNAPVPPVNNIWWDVFPIPASFQATLTTGSGSTQKTVNVGVPIVGYFQMATNIVDYTGSYVLHCHILAHEDRGMMFEVNVSPGTSLGQPAANQVHFQHH